MPKATRYSYRLTVGLTAADGARLQGIAERRGADVSGLIREAVREWMARQAAYERLLARTTQKSPASGD